MLNVGSIPRSPRKSAEDMMRRGYSLGDPVLIARGKAVLRYAEDQESRTIYHDRFETGSPAERKATWVGAVLGFLGMSVWLAAPWVGLFTVVGWLLVLMLGCAAAYATFMAVKRARW